MPTPPERFGGGGDGGRDPSRPAPDVALDVADVSPKDDELLDFEALPEPDVPARPDPAAPAAAAGAFELGEVDDADDVAAFGREPATAGAAAFCEPPAASLAGLAAALAMPALDGLPAALVAVADGAGAAGAADEAVPPAAGVVPTAVGVAALVADLALPEDGVAVAAGVADSLAPALAGASGCFAGSGADDVAPPEVAALAALVVSPWLTVVVFSALRSIVWLRGFAGLDRRGRLVIASAPCSRVGPRVAIALGTGFLDHWSFIRAHGASTEYTLECDVG